MQVRSRESNAEWRRRALSIMGAALIVASCARAENEKAPVTAAPPATPAFAPAPAEAPPSSEAAPADDLQTLERAEAAFERARAELDAATVAFADTRDRSGRAEEQRAAGSVQPSAPAPAPAKQERRKQPSAGAGAVRADKAAEKPTDDGAGMNEEHNLCETACKAWSSLLRAKAAICRLDTPTGARCARAEDVVRNAEARVSACGCKQ